MHVISCRMTPAFDICPLDIKLISTRRLGINIKFRDGKSPVVGITLKTNCNAACVVTFCLGERSVDNGSLDFPLSATPR